MQHPGQCLDQFCLAESGNTFEKHVSAANDCRQRALDHPILPNDDLAYFAPDTFEVFLEAGGFSFKYT